MGNAAEFCFFYPATKTKQNYAVFPTFSKLIMATWKDALRTNNYEDLRHFFPTEESLINSRVEIYQVLVSTYSAYHQEVAEWHQQNPQGKRGIRLGNDRSPEHDNLYKAWRAIQMRNKRTFDEIRALLFVKPRPVPMVVEAESIPECPVCMELAPLIAGPCHNEHKMCSKCWGLNFKDGQCLCPFCRLDVTAHFEAVLGIERAIPEGVAIFVPPRGLHRCRFCNGMTDHMTRNCPFTQDVRDRIEVRGQEILRLRADNENDQRMLADAMLR